MVRLALFVRMPHSGMPFVPSATFQTFVQSEKSGGALLIVCTALSMALANSALGPAYLAFWHTPVAGMSLEHWVNDALMAVFFLFVGLELERELYNGELSDFRTALLPIFAAFGGVAVPAAIHFALNAGTATQAGTGIPMATDIAFALAVLALLGGRVPLSLKVFLTALAVMDDLVAIVVIAIFYTSAFSALSLAGALAVWGLLLVLNLRFRVMALTPYLVGGALMWWLMLQSGVHATIAGVLLAFAIPFSPRADDEASPSHRLEHALHRPVAFAILPVFALANTGIVVSTDSLRGAWGSPITWGVVAGLVLGKPLGVLLATRLAVRAGVGDPPADSDGRHLLGAGTAAGIGFTVALFIAELAFVENGVPNQEHIADAKMAILLGSLLSGVVAFALLRRRSSRTRAATPSAAPQ